MGIKTTVGAQGVVSEKVAGDDEVVISVKVKRETTNFPNTTTTASLTTETVAVFEAATDDVVVQLPTVGSANVGLEFTVINADVSNDLILSGATGQGIDSGTLLFTVAEESATIMAVSSALDGYAWIVTSTKA